MSEIIFDDATDVMTLDTGDIEYVLTLPEVNLLPLSNVYLPNYFNLEEQRIQEMPVKLSIDYKDKEVRLTGELAHFMITEEAAVDSITLFNMLKDNVTTCIDIAAPLANTTELLNYLKRDLEDYDTPLLPAMGDKRLFAVILDKDVLGFGHYQKVESSSMPFVIKLEKISGEFNTFIDEENLQSFTLVDLKSKNQLQAFLKEIKGDNAVFEFRRYSDKYKGDCLDLEKIITQGDNIEKSYQAFINTKNKRKEVLDF